MNKECIQYQQLPLKLLGEMVNYTSRKLIKYILITRDNFPKYKITVIVR